MWPSDAHHVQHGARAEVAALSLVPPLELYDGHGVERLQLPTNRRRWQSSPPAPTSQGDTARKARGSIRRLAGGAEAVWSDILETSKYAV
jgi:hypothetical protein